METPGLDRMTQELSAQGWTFFSDYLGLDLAQSLRAEALALYEDDQFRRAKIGPTDEELLRSDIRRDSILWFNPKKPTAIQLQFSEKIECLMFELGQRLFLSLQSFEAHYALYPYGGFYKKHLDQFQADCLRQLSFVVYLNESWEPGYGGQLRMYNERNSEQVDIDIQPEMGTAVLFLSSSMYHEVLPTVYPRVSLTGWMKKELFTPGPIVE